MEKIIKIIFHLSLRRKETAKSPSNPAYAKNNKEELTTLSLLLCA